MSDFKEKLTQELKLDAPFTKDVEERIVTFKSKRKTYFSKPVLSLAGIAIIALFFVFLFQQMQRPDSLMDASEVPTTPEGMIKLLQQNEVTLPLLDEVKGQQEVVNDAKIWFHGKMSVFSSHSLIVEKNDKLQRGDYVLVEHSGEKYVRQVVGFEGETYSSKDGNLFINNRRLMLPGYSYMKVDGEIDFRIVSSYFHQDQYFTLGEKERVISEEEILVSEITRPLDLVYPIRQDQVLAKVVGIKKVVPTYLLTGEDKKLYESFKEDKDVQKLVGVDPIVMARMHLTAQLEKDLDTLYALMPWHVKVYKFSTEEIEEYYVNHAFDFTQEERDSLSANSYNGIENSQIEYAGAKAILKWNRIFQGEEYETGLTMLLNSDGFWEVTYN